MDESGVAATVAATTEEKSSAESVTAKVEPPKVIPLEKTVSSTEHVVSDAVEKSAEGAQDASIVLEASVKEAALNDAKIETKTEVDSVRVVTESAAAQAVVTTESSSPKMSNDEVSASSSSSVEATTTDDASSPSAATTSDSSANMHEKSAESTTTAQEESTLNPSEGEPKITTTPVVELLEAKTPKGRAIEVTAFNETTTTAAKNDASTTAKEEKLLVNDMTTMPSTAEKMVEAKEKEEMVKVNGAGSSKNETSMDDEHLSIHQELENQPGIISHDICYKDGILHKVSTSIFYY